MMRDNDLKRGKQHCTRELGGRNNGKNARVSIGIIILDS